VPTGKAIRCRWQRAGRDGRKRFGGIGKAYPVAQMAVWVVAGCVNVRYWGSPDTQEPGRWGIGGAGGIRTLDTAFQPYNGLANRRLQPLGHSTPGYSDITCQAF
jgi:hypothetical protein